MRSIATGLVLGSVLLVTAASVKVTRSAQAVRRHLRAAAASVSSAAQGPLPLAQPCVEPSRPAVAEASPGVAETTTPSEPPTQAANPLEVSVVEMARKICDDFLSSDAAEGDGGLAGLIAKESELGDAVVAELRLRLGHVDAAKRVRILTALAGVGDEDAAREWLAAVRTDADPSVRLALARRVPGGAAALGEVGDEVVRLALRGDDTQVCEALAAALPREAVLLHRAELLQCVAEEPRTGLREAVLSALWKGGVEDEDAQRAYWGVASDASLPSRLRGVALAAILDAESRGPVVVPVAEIERLRGEFERPQ